MMILFFQPAASLAQDPYQSTVAHFLAKHCLMCHSTKAKAANLDLERLQDGKAALAERDVWERVAQRVKSGQMPPPGPAKPTPESAQAVVEWAQKHIESVDRARKTQPGRVTARRLNRSEYNNTIRDLFGITFRPADDFPLDDSGHGFDNIGDVLSLSPVLLEKYLQAADKIVTAALVNGPAPKPVMEKFDADKIGPPENLPADPEGERLIRKNSLLVKYRFPRDGEYELRVFTRGRGAPGSPPAPLAVIGGGGGKLVELIKVKSGVNTKYNFDIRFKASAGLADVGAAWVFPGPVDPGPPDPTGVDFTMLVETIELRGPFIDAAAGLPESHRRVFICSEHDSGCARKILANFAAKAWRRPVTDAELSRLVRFVDLAAQEGDSFESGIQLAVKAVLVSSRFLFRIERDQGAARALNGYELASRLSYFLWASMPDDALFAAAGDGSLLTPAGLSAHIRRMLADPKVNALATNFAGQWLELRNLDSVSPDPKRFPEWDADLREAMRRETLLFFSTLLTEDRGILDIIDGKFTFVNERLAKHYGIPNITGRKFQRVDLDGERRSGVLTQASVLTVTSYPTRTSPVQRGLWVLGNFLATPPPPPPANVPELDEAKTGAEMSLRQQMERHRADPNCAVCHTEMDGLGFGLENYDAVGAWRSHDGKFPVDSAGTLPGGRSFTNPMELKTILRAGAEAFTQCLTEKMLTYALGRGLEPGDRPVVRAIAKKVESEGHKLSTLIREIALSPPFQQRGSDRLAQPAKVVR